MNTNSPVPKFGEGDTSFQAAGRYDGIKKLVDCFYDYMEVEPEALTILRLHPGDLEESRDKLTRFLCGWLGGPKLFSEKYGAIKIPVAHKHLPIGDAERDAWLMCMRKAAQEQPYSDAFKAYFMEQIRVPAERVRAVAVQPEEN